MLSLITQVKMTANRMFSLFLHTVAHSCFSTSLKDSTWLWHYRYGHLNFGALKSLQQKEMVIGLPQITVPSQFVKIVLLANNTRIHSHKESLGEQRNHWSWCILTFVVLLIHLLNEVKDIKIYNYLH